MTAGSAALFIMAGTVSLAISLLQFVMYFGGPAVYRLCGTPESLIAFYLRRPVAALFIEILVAFLFATFAAYAYSGAKIIGPLPMLAPGLTVTAVIYLGRGLFVVPQIAGGLELSAGRDVLYTCMAIAVGVAYALPTLWHWEELRSMS